MRKITQQDVSDLSFRVQMLLEKVEQLAPVYVESFQQLNKRLIRLEDVITVEKRILTSQEAAEYLGISRNLLYQLIKYNNLPYNKPKRKMLFDKDKLDEWISSNSQIKSC